MLERYRPELTRCLACGADLQPGMNFLSTTHGGALCGDCGPQQAGAHAVGVDVLKLLRHLQRTESPGAINLRLPPALEDEVDREARSFAEYQVDRRLKSPEFISRLRHLPAASINRPSTAQRAR